MNEIAKSGEVLPPINLPALIKQINDHHTVIVSAAKAVVTRAIAAGEALIQAKAAVPDGTWLSWLKRHCTVSDRTAQLYMRLAEHKLQLETEARERGATIADQTLNGAIKLLSAKTTRPSKPKDSQLACTRFRRHQVWCDNGIGGRLCRGGSLRGSSSLRPCA
jgi:hypothetical protein